MAIMLLSQYADFMGVDPVTMWRYAKEGRISGLITLKPRISIIDTDTVKILPNPNYKRRLDGNVIGRSKPLRGEPGFKEK